MKHFIACAAIFIISACSTSSDWQDDVSGSNNDTDGLFCPTGSTYDSLEDACYIDCEGLSDEQCDQLDEEVFGDFDEYFDDDYEGIGSSDNYGSEDATAIYAIQSDLSLKAIDNQQPEDDKLFRSIWTAVTELLPHSALRQSLTEFSINTDGKDGLLAFVQPDEFKPGKWIIAFDDADFINKTDGEFIHTTVHEFGHLVFLDESQFNRNLNGECTSYSLDEGCLATDSFLNQFYTKFWSGIIKEHKQSVGGDEDEEAIGRFYDKYQSQFVSEYAATNPVEDIAEIFTRFVLSNRPAPGGTIAQQKVYSMYRHGPLVKMRSTIRGKLKNKR